VNIEYDERNVKIRDRYECVDTGFCTKRVMTPDLVQSHSYQIFILRGPFEMFVDSPYHSESEFCGGAVTVSFSKYPPGQAM
jgi:hypothetical protein